MMRGYRTLKQQGRLGQIAAVKRTLTETPVASVSGKLSQLVLGFAAAAGEIVVRQYLLSRVGGINLNRALLIASATKEGRVVHYLPKEWRQIIEQHGFEVAHVRSALLWQLYVLAHLFHGIVAIGKIAVRALTSGRQAVLKRYVYFADLGSGNLPQHGTGMPSHDIVSWYLQWPGRAVNIEAVRHGVAGALPINVNDVDVSFTARPLSDLEGVLPAASYCAWAGRATAIALLDWLRGRWWHALLLSQAALAGQVAKLPAGSLAAEYLFPNSEWIYRPLWTYEVERRGSLVTFYFYSTNCEAFKRADGYPAIPYGWKAMNWPHYLVWNNYQADFVRRAVGDRGRISSVGSIWFQSSNAELPSLPRTTLAVFDVQPVRDAFYTALALDFDYFTPTTANQFLADICRIAKLHGCSVALKRKREIGSLAHPSYRDCVRRLESSRGFIAVDANIPALRLIENCIAVVSMPFTSTALMGEEAGRPSVYYDPHRVLQKDDRAAHAISILSGPEELDRWLSGVLAATNQRVVDHA